VCRKSREVSETICPMVLSDDASMLCLLIVSPFKKSNDNQIATFHNPLVLIHEFLEPREQKP